MGLWVYVTVGCEPEQADDREQGSGERRKVAPPPPSGGIANSWGNSLLIEGASAQARSVAGRPAAGQAAVEPLKLYGCAFSRIKSTPHHHSHARLATPCQGQVTRASKPAKLTNNHRTPKPPSFLTRLRNHIPFDARLVSRWLGLLR